MRSACGRRARVPVALQRRMSFDQARRGGQSPGAAVWLRPALVADRCSPPRAGLRALPARDPRQGWLSRASHAGATLRSPVLSDAVFDAVRAMHRAVHRAVSSRHSRCGPRMIQFSLEAVTPVSQHASIATVVQEAAQGSAGHPIPDTDAHRAASRWQPAPAAGSALHD